MYMNKKNLCKGPLDIDVFCDDVLEPTAALRNEKSNKGLCFSKQEIIIFSALCVEICNCSILTNTRHDKP